MTEPSLQDLYEFHDGKQSDKWSGYLPAYERVLACYRDRPIGFLEIGVQNGGSLEIWAKYFPGATHIIGCDVDPACAALRYTDSRITVIVGDAKSHSTQQAIAKLCERFDVVIDDGSHTSEDIIRSFCHYFSLLKPGGVFIAEDLHCGYWMEYAGGLHDPASSVAFFRVLVDFIHQAHWAGQQDAEIVLKPFTDRYGPVEFDPRQIESVEFVDSLCIVRKCAPGAGRLGVRVVRGASESVCQGNQTFDGLPLVPPDQTANPNTSAYLGMQECARLRDDLLKARTEAQLERERHKAAFADLADQLSSAVDRQADIERQHAATQGELAAVRTSRSWQVTAPLRMLGMSIRRARRAGGVVAREVSSRGGWLHAARLLQNVLRVEGVGGLVLRLKRARSMMAQKVPELPGTSKVCDYSEWIRRYDTLDDAGRDRIRQRIDAFSMPPLISVVMPVYNPPLDLLDEAICSVRAQLYPHWELCIADDASPNAAVRELLQRHAAEDERIKLILRERNGHISAASNSALELASGEFVALMDHDDLLPEHALFWVADAIHRNPDAALIYSDEDKITVEGERYAPYFKCDYNPELLLAQNMISHLGVYRREVLERIGGFREGFEGSQDYDLALRVIDNEGAAKVLHIPRVLYHWRAIPGSTALGAGEKNYAVDAGRRAVAEHLERRGLKGEVLPVPEAPAFNRVRFSLDGRQPLVSILIPTRDRADLLSQCVDSIQSRSTWPHYEIIIIDNGSVEPATFALFDRIRSERVRIIREDAPFNFSALNNLAAAHAKGEVLCLLNNDIEVQTPDWIEEMLGFALRPEIGCVGARLWYPDGRLQHGGVVLGIGGVAGHAFKYFDRGSHGYFGRAQLHQSYSAVTGACLMIRKDIYDRAGGLDEQLAVAFNDIDFCLRVRALGYRNVWTPYAELIHHESVSRGTEDSPAKKARFASEVLYMQDKWGGELREDPAYNPNLTLEHEDFSLGWPAHC